MAFVHNLGYMPLRGHMKYEDFKDLVEGLKEIHKSPVIIYHQTKGDIICADKITRELRKYILDNFGEFCELRPYCKGFYLLSTPLPSVSRPTAHL